MKTKISQIRIFYDEGYVVLAGYDGRLSIMRICSEGGRIKHLKSVLTFKVNQKLMSAHSPELFQINHCGRAANPGNPDLLFFTCGGNGVLGVYNLCKREIVHESCVTGKSPPRVTRRRVSDHFDVVLPLSRAPGDLLGVRLEQRRARTGPGRLPAPSHVEASG